MYILCFAQNLNLFNVSVGQLYDACVNLPITIYLFGYNPLMCKGKVIYSMFI